MTKLKNLPVHTLIGGMTTDYFDFWCEDCDAHIDGLHFASEDIVGVRLKASCPKCNKEIVFKLRITPPLSTR